MTTFNLVTTGNTSFSKGETKQPYLQQYFLDFAVNPAGSSSDVYKVIALPAGAMVLGVSAEVVKAATTSTTLEIGDTGSATRYLTATAADSTAGTLIAPTTYTAHFYTAADVIELTVGGATPIVGQFVVTVILQDMNYNAAAGVATL